MDTNNDIINANPLKNSWIEFKKNPLWKVFQIIVWYYDDCIREKLKYLGENIGGEHMKKLIGCIPNDIGGLMIVVFIANIISILIYEFVVSRCQRIKKYKHSFSLLRVFIVCILIVAWLNFFPSDGQTEPPIGDCFGDYGIKPCWFNTTNGYNASIPIAGLVYNDERDAWRIAELIRDNDGIISEFPTRVLIPDKERTIDSLLFNLNIILGHNFTICSPKSLQFPCLLETTAGDSYQLIAGNYYDKFIEGEIIKRLERANDFEYYIKSNGDGDLRQLSSPFSEGTIVYLPTPK